MATNKVSFISSHLHYFSRCRKYPAVFSGKRATRLVAACKWMFALRFNSESAYPATSARMAECYVAKLSSKQICSCVYNTAVIIFVKPNVSLSDTRS